MDALLVSGCTGPHTAYDACAALLDLMQVVHRHGHTTSARLAHVTVQVCEYDRYVRRCARLMEHDERPLQCVSW